MIYFSLFVLSCTFFTQIQYFLCSLVQFSKNRILPLSLENHLPSTYYIVSIFSQAPILFLKLHLLLIDQYSLTVDSTHGIRLTYNLQPCSAGGTTIDNLINISKCVSNQFSNQYFSVLLTRQR